MNKGQLECYWNTMSPIRTHLLALGNWPVFPERKRFPPTAKYGFWQEKREGSYWVGDEQGLV